MDLANYQLVDKAYVDRPPVPRSPKASSRDPNARPGRNAKVTWDLPPETPSYPPERRPDRRSRTHRRAAATAAARADSGISEDASSLGSGSFPILSPDHKFDDGGASFFGNNDDAEEETNATREGGGTDDADAKKEGGDRDDDDADDARGAKADDREAAVGARRSRDVDDDADAKESGNRGGDAADDAHSPPPPTPQSTDDAAAGRLRRRVAEIRSRRDDLARGIAKKALIKGTLITAIDDNLVKSMREMELLDSELEKIQLRTTTTAMVTRRRRRPDGDRPVENGAPNDAAERARRARSPSGAYDRLSSLDADDPGITADTESVADLHRREEEESGRRKTATAPIGLDPPACRSPPTAIRRRRPAIREEGTRDGYPRGGAARHMEPDGSRISAVLRDDGDSGFENYDGMHADGRNDVPRPMQLSYPRTKASSTRRNAFSSSEIPPLRHYRNGQYEQPWQERRPSQNNAPERGKLVRFDSSSESDSEELKFANYDDDSPSMNGTDAISCENEEFGSFVSYDHHDFHQLTSDQHRVTTSGNYSGEMRHRRHHRDDGGKSSSILNIHNNYNKGVSSDSVETDPDLGFIHAVAAVVIQTAVRRFLAEIAVVERQYAVRVIQTAICNWMARNRSSLYISSETNEFQQMARNRNPLYIPRETNQSQKYSNGIFYDVREHVSHNNGSLQRTKRVMFEDDYNDFRDFAATEIQRCYRGWWTREGLQVEHFAATAIQRQFRGWWAREGLDVDRYCAVEIQRIVRGHLARMTYVYDVYCIVVAQSAIRRHLSFHTAAIRLASILYIQAIYRGFRVRSELIRYVRNGQEVAATFIQARWRSYDAQMQYINTLADILIVQSIARRWLTMRKLKRIFEMKPKHEKIRHDKQMKNRNQSHAPTKKNPHVAWQQHRLNVVARPLTAKKSDSLIGFDAFAHDIVGGEEWYDGNKSETNDMLKNWKRRSK